MHKKGFLPQTQIFLPCLSIVPALYREYDKSHSIWCQVVSKYTVRKRFSPNLVECINTPVQYPGRLYPSLEPRLPSKEERGTCIISSLEGGLGQGYFSPAFSICSINVSGGGSPGKTCLMQWCTLGEHLEAWQFLVMLRTNSGMPPWWDRNVWCPLGRGKFVAETEELVATSESCLC